MVKAAEWTHNIHWTRHRHGHVRSGLYPMLISTPVQQHVYGILYCCKQKLLAFFVCPAKVLAERQKVCFGFLLFSLPLQKCMLCYLFLFVLAVHSVSTNARQAFNEMKHLMRFYLISTEKAI